MMGIRERINDNRGLTIGVICVVIAIGVGMIVVQVLANRKAYPTKLPDAYYSIDDGQTFFAENSENIAPFEYKGKTAVRAYVFACSDGKQFVGYLERYTPEARRAIVVEKKSGPQLQIYGRELKKPGAATWTKSGDFAGIAKVTDLHCPDGKFPEPVEPQ
jgi:hypothetical protein